MQRKRPDIAKKLRLRIKALETSDTLGDLLMDDPGGGWHELKGDRKGTWAGNLSGNWRLLINSKPNELNSVEVTVISLEDYHKK